MNQTQRKFVIDQAIEILFDKIEDFHAEQTELAKELRDKHKVTQRGVHRLFATGKIPLKASMPKEDLHSNSDLSEYFDTTALEEYIASKKAKHLKRSQSHYSPISLTNPISGVTRKHDKNKGNSYIYVDYESVDQLIEKYQKELNKLATTLMLTSAPEALTLLEQIKKL